MNSNLGADLCTDQRMVVFELHVPPALTVVFAEEVGNAVGFDDTAFLPYPEDLVYVYLPVLVGRLDGDEVEALYEANQDGGIDCAVEIGDEGAFNDHVIFTKINGRWWRMLEGGIDALSHCDV